MAASASRMAWITVMWIVVLFGTVGLIQMMAEGKPVSSTTSGWPCSNNCGNVNHVLSSTCHKCGEPSSGDSGGGGGRLKQCDENCDDLCNNSRIYISNLPIDVTIDELILLFRRVGQIARIKQAQESGDVWTYNIKLYTDDQGNHKGDGVLSYEDPAVAHIACKTLNYCDLRGHKISVTMDAKSAHKAPTEFDRGVDVEESSAHREIQEIEEDPQMELSTRHVSVNISGLTRGMQPGYAPLPDQEVSHEVNAEEGHTSMGRRLLVSSLAFLKETFSVRAFASSFVIGLVLAVAAGCYTQIDKYYYKSSHSQESTVAIFPTFPGPT